MDNIKERFKDSILYKVEIKENKEGMVYAYIVYKPVPKRINYARLHRFTNHLYNHKIMPFKISKLISELLTKLEHGTKPKFDR